MRCQRLATDVYRLDDATPTPVLLTRTPYDKEHALGSTTIDVIRAVQAGYVVVIQCRKQRRIGQLDAL